MTSSLCLGYIPLQSRSFHHSNKLIENRYRFFIFELIQNFTFTHRHFLRRQLIFIKLANKLGCKKLTCRTRANFVHFRKAAFPQETKNLELISKIHLHDIFSDLLFLLIPNSRLGKTNILF